jgi:hypothetical protein
MTTQPRRRIIIRFDEYFNYEIVVYRRNWWWRFESQYRRTSKIDACRLAIALGRNYGCGVIDLT